MRILVTGGTGFLGSRLVQRLLDSGKSVTVFSRHGSEELAAKGARVVAGDITDKQQLAAAFPADVVYHLAANLDDADPQQYHVNVKGTWNAVELAREKGTKALVLMSSCGVLGGVAVASEDEKPDPRTAYERSKAESERIVKESGIPYCIIRAPVIIGPNDIWMKIFAAAKAAYPIVGSGKNRFHLAYVDDVVELLLLALTHSAAKDQTFNVATSDVPTFQEVYGMVCEELGIEKQKKHAPLFAVRMMSSFDSLASRLHGKKQKLTMMKSSIDRVTRDRVVPTEKAKMLGFEPKYDTRTAIRETAKYLKIAKLGYSQNEIAEMQKKTAKKKG